jgi:hypothetical protein
MKKIPDVLKLTDEGGLGGETRTVGARSCWDRDPAADDIARKMAVAGREISPARGAPRGAIALGKASSDSRMPGLLGARWREGKDEPSWCG